MEVKSNESKVFKECVFQLEIVENVFIFRQLSPVAPPKVVFCGNCDEAAEFLRKM